MDGAAGLQIIVVASGPSLTREQCAATAGHAVLSVSRTFEWLPHARWHYAADDLWWRTYHRDVHIPARYCWSPSACRRHSLTHVQGLKGNNSGTHGIELAARLGASRIVLLGYDFQQTDGRTHWHEDYPWLNNAANCGAWIGNLAAVLADLTIPVVNCTPTTAIPESLVPRAMLADILTPDRRHV